MSLHIQLCGHDYTVLQSEVPHDCPVLKNFHPDTELYMQIEQYENTWSALCTHVHRYGKTHSFINLRLQVQLCGHPLLQNVSPGTQYVFH